MPWALLAALPELPPAAVAVAFPDVPEVAVTMIAPDANVSPEPLTVMITVTDPVFPEVGVAVALPPLPLVADEELSLVAFPELPVLPDWADELLLELPDCADPVELGLAVAVPVSPVDPELPEVAPPVEVPDPEPPLAELPEPPLPVEPDVAESVDDAGPLAPEPPVSPVVAELVLVGLDAVEPVSPPVELELPAELPTVPDWALSCVLLANGPAVPPVT